MKKMIGILMMLHLLFACAMAQSRPMTDYTAGQIIDVGFARPVRFMAGCVLESGEGFMFVEAEAGEGHLLNATGRIARDQITLLVPIPNGYSAEVTARDAKHCMVRVFGRQESHVYSYVWEQVQKYEEPWKLREYEYKSGDRTFTVQFSHDRAQTKEVSGKNQQEYTTFYQFFVEANNINYEKIPTSIDELKKMEEQYPVAAVSPEDPSTRVNLRKGPSTKAERVGSLYSGARLRIREIENGWAKIYVGDTDAYISTDFLTFGAKIEQVEDARPSVVLPDREWIDVSRAPYRGGGGTATRTQGGQTVRIIGEYNSQWRIVGTNSGSYYIHVDDLK